MSPPWAETSATSTSVRMIALGAATGAAAGAWPGTALAPGAVVGVGTPAVPAALATGAATLGWLCFCHPSHSMTSENEKTRRRIRRRLSIGVSVWK